MPTFHYKAVRTEGETYEGDVETSDRFAVYAEVRKGGGTVLSIDEVHHGFNLNLHFLTGFLGRVRMSDKIIFARNLGAMLTAGLPLSRGLAVLERETKNKKLKGVIGSISEAIRRGESLHEAMAPYPSVFPKLFTAMVKAGEESGKLSESLAVVADQTERIYNLNKKIRGAMMYPGIILSLMLLMGIAMLVYVVPTLTETFKSFNVELPLTTRIIIGASDFLVGNLLLVIFGAILIVAGVISAFRTPKGKRMIEAVFLHLPIIGPLVRETNAARTARTLSSLLSSGVEVVGAIGITADVVQNSFFREVLVEAQEEIQKGRQIASVFSAHENLYPPLVGELIAVGEETGKLSEMLLQVASFYENEVEQKTKNMSTIIEPALMVVIGAGVGFFALSVISPIYSLSSAI